MINSREGEDGPYAIRTILGWVINGPLRGSSDCGSDHPSVHANRIAIDRIEELLTSQYNYNFNEQASAEQEEMSREVCGDNGKLCSASEWTLHISNAFQRERCFDAKQSWCAMQRVCGLKRRLQKDASFHEEYSNFLADVISNGYAE